MYAQFSQRTDLNISLNAKKELNRQSDQLLQICSKTFFIYTKILFLDFCSLKFNCIFRILQVDSFILITAIYQMQSNCHIPYILVGAGISSLQAALILAEHKKDFIILEASNRIGGRICSLPLREALAGDLRNQKEWLKEAENDPIECGGTWICEDNHIMLQYVNKYKLTKTEQFYTGKHVLAEDYQKYRQCGSLGEYYEQYKDKIMKLFASMEKIQERVTQLSNKKEQKNITLEEQVELRNIYKEYDNMSAYEFILKEVEDEFLAKLLNKQASTLQCCESKDYSLFSLIQGQPLANVKFYVGAQAANIDGYRLKEGMSSIYQNIKADIQQIFDAQGQGKQIDQLIKLQSPVLQIKNAKVPVEVITKNQRYTCDKVVMGVPLGTLGKINIQELSAGKRLIANNQVTCNMTRMAMIFKQPFWRKQFAGYVSFSHNFPMNQIVDLTPHQQKYGILAFVFNSNGFQEWSKSITADCDHKQGPQHQREWYQINQRKALQIVANIYLNGDINSPHLKDVPIFAKSMSQYEYIKSTYQSTTALAVADKVYQAGDDINKCFTRDQLNIIILGSDFSDEFAGYMEGAIRIARKKMYAECQSKDPLEYLTAVKGFQSTSGEPKL